MHKKLCLSALARAMRYQFASKRIQKLKDEKIDLGLVPEYEKSAEHAGAQKQIKMRQNIPSDWSTMSFDQLCAIKPAVLRQLELQVLKSKMSVGDDKFKTQALVEDPEEELNPYWQHIYKTICNLKEIDETQLQRIYKNQYLATMYVEDLLEDESLATTIQKFVDNIRFPQKLETVAQPTFCKYLLSLRRDLLMQGLDVDTYWRQEEQNRKVKVLEILDFQHEFWVDVKHNRSRNGNEENFIIQKKKIKNPNTSLIITEQWPQIDVTYITRKKKSKDYDMCFCTKTKVLVMVGDKKHVVKVEKKGPTTLKDDDQAEKYSVIDYDGVFRENPTVKPIFSF